jgi:glucosamine-6-phosphate deaminase
MHLRILKDRSTLGKAAAEQGASAIRRAIAKHGKARIVGASAASQFEFLEALVAAPEIDWSRVELFHLDEYIGIPPTHPASFCRFLEERLVAKTGIPICHFLRGDEDSADVIARSGAAIAASPIHVAFVGIGENGHLAFNDPPADFETEEPFIVVELDDACRRQQVGEGWFESLDAVPTRAVSMSVRQVLKAEEILAIVPGPKKANAIRACMEGPISPKAPASILRTHGNAAVYLDRDSSSLLSGQTLRAFTRNEAVEV